MLAYMVYDVLPANVWYADCIVFYREKQIMKSNDLHIRIVTLRDSYAVTLQADCVLSERIFRTSAATRWYISQVIMLAQDASYSIDTPVIWQVAYTLPCDDCCRATIFEHDYVRHEVRPVEIFESGSVSETVSAVNATINRATKSGVIVL
jgi:hypothetical protein